MLELAHTDADPLRLLRGRIAYRKTWALRAPDEAKPLRIKDVKWFLQYDVRHNFAHIGIRLIDDPSWGQPPPKRRARRVRKKKLDSNDDGTSNNPKR